MVSLANLNCGMIIFKHYFLVPCDPPQTIKPVAIDKTTVKLTWDSDLCFGNATQSNVYIYYTEMGLSWSAYNDDKNWNVVGVPINSLSIVITDLTPAIKYKGYMMQSTSTGNGPPSSVFIMETPVGREYSIYNLCF